MNTKKILISISIILSILVIFWGYDYIKHSSPERVIGLQSIGKVPFADGVVIISQGENNTLNASYLTLSFFGWKINKTSTIQSLVTTSDIDSTWFSVNDHTFVWGLKKPTTKDVYVIYGGKTYISKNVNSNSIWYLNLPLTHSKFLDSTMSINK